MGDHQLQLGKMPAKADIFDKSFKAFIWVAPARFGDGDKVWPQNNLCFNTVLQAPGVMRVQVEEPKFQASSYIWATSIGALSALNQAVMILLLTHLALFAPWEDRTKKWVIGLGFGSSFVGEASGWLVRLVPVNGP